MTTAAAQRISGPPKRSVLKKKASAQQAIAASHVAFDGSAATIDLAARSSADAIASNSSAAGLLDPALIISASTIATVAKSVASPEPTETRVVKRVPASI
jgi:phage tail sheath gpL-like